MKRFYRHQVFWGGLVFVWLFGWYALTAATTPTGLTDADELMAAGYGLKAAHPPGYPVLVGLIFLTSHLPLPLAPVHQVNLLAALMMALAGCGFWMVFNQSLKLSRGGKAGLPIMSHLAAAWGTIMVFSMVPIWLQGVVMEVVGWSLLLALGSLVFIGQLYLKPKEAGNWYGLALTLGLMVMHHQLSWWWVPGLVILMGPLVKQWWRQGQISTPVRALGLWLLVILAQWWWLDWLTAAPMDWHWLRAPGIKGLGAYFFRDIYGGLRVETGLNQTTYVTAVKFKEFWSLAYRYFFSEVVENLSWGAIGLALVGLVLGAKTWPKTWFMGLLVLTLTLTLGVGGYLAVSLTDGSELTNLGDRLINLRMYVPGLMWLGFWAAYTISLANRQRSSWGIVLLGLSVMWWLAIFPGNLEQIRQVTQSQWWPVMKTAIDQLPPESVVICLGDATCFSLWYVNEVLEERQDLRVVTASPYLVSGTEVGVIGYPDNPFRIGEAISWARENGRPSYVAELTPYYRDFLGLGQGVFLPQSGNIWQRLDCLLEVSSMPEVTEALFPGENLVQRWRQAWYEQQTTSEDGSGICQGGLSLIKAMERCTGDQATACRLRNAWWAVMLEPRMANFRFNLGQVLETAGWPALAKREYRLSLALDPSKVAAGEAVSRLQGVAELPWGLNQIYVDF